MFATLLGPYPPIGPETPGATIGNDAVGRTVAELAAAGIEPLSDGEPAWAAHGHPGAVAERWRVAAAATDRLVKQAVVGPYTLGSSDGPDDGVDRLAAAIDGLVAAGCPLVEVEEPAATAIADDIERRRFADLHRRLTSGRSDRVHLSLVFTGGSVEALGADTLFDLPYASYAFDLIAGPDNWRLIAKAPGDRGIICGALDPAASADDGPEVLVWAARYAASTRGRGLVRVGLANASSLAGLSRERANRKVRALAEAARLASAEWPDELAAGLDPRAVDIRSAAAGRYEPPPKRRTRRGRQ
jgi:methionine synthase II (cobalamin-independent)